MSAKLLVLLVLACVFNVSLCGTIVMNGDLPYEGFFRAFPNANVSALLSIPPEVFNENHEEPYVSSFSLSACPALSPVPDTDDVNNLKPGNIKMVMAMGDSITAGMSAKDTFILFLKEYRGLSYGIGGDSGVVTMPNILRPFAQSVYGASTGVGKREISTNGYNAGVSGAKSQDMPGQAQWLVDKLKSDPKVGGDDWKLLTIWIGSNNLCDVCEDQAGNNGADYETQLTKALDILYAIPRLFVNLVAPMDVSTLHGIDGAVCSTVHSIACACAGSSSVDKRNQVSQAAADMQNKSYTIASQFNAKGRKDFAVIVQPFLEHNIITDRSLLSAADCFHPSAKGQELGAIALWNNMLTPAVNKKTSWNEADVPICPTEDSKFYTN